MEGDYKYRQVLTKAMAWCSQSEKCRFDLVVKFRQWELPEPEIKQAIDFLIKERFLDEERFVRFFVNDKLRLNKWGKNKISFLLRQKQIPDELINTELAQIDADLYEKTLTDLLTSKAKLVKGATTFERRGKLAVFAQSHGFEANLAFRIANELIGNDLSDEE